MPLLLFTTSGLPNTTCALDFEFLWGKISGPRHIPVISGDQGGSEGRDERMLRSQMCESLGCFL